MAKRTFHGWRYPAATLSLTAIVALTTFVGAAWAHTQFEQVTPYSTDPQCVELHATLDHPPGGGEYLVEVYSFHDPLLIPYTECVLAKYKPPGWMILLRRYWKWTGSAWAVCQGTDWVANQNSQYRIYNQRINGATAPCGAGWYFLSMDGHVWHEGAWRGGYVFTREAHWMPSF